MAILISFDIDGTLEIGDPPGAVTMEMVRIARKRGFITGSCSDRPMSTQRAIWREHDIEFDFVCYKHMLPNLKEDFKGPMHIGMWEIVMTLIESMLFVQDLISCGPMRLQ
ncbi:MAG: hypothetical protein CM1200mP3_07280 [Chloroflexota bacterium]|nr:MAG: hypothetical protein CM1200mP3_07280 [Chloroflexota bacterium]